jgi:hypothetical protein
MNKEDIIEAIRIGQIHGEFTLEELKDALDNSLPTLQEMTNVDILHLLTCPDIHSQIRCKYYIEEQLVDTWKLEDHKLWLIGYRGYLERHEITSSIATKELAIISGIAAQINSLKYKPEWLFNYIYNINKG